MILFMQGGVDEMVSSVLEILPHIQNDQIFHFAKKFNQLELAQKFHASRD